MAALRIILHGKAAADPRVREAVAAVRDSGHTVEVRVTFEAGDAARLTREAVADAHAGRIGTIVAGGGDGTINEVFAAAIDAGPPPECSFGILPLGTANDFARSTGIPHDDLTAALTLAAGDTIHRIDVARLNGRPFFNMVTGGFGSRVTVETDPGLKRRLGAIAYVLTGVTRFGELSACQGIFRTEEMTWEGAFIAMAIGNGRQAGGGIPLCPDALLDDGKLDLTILPEFSADQTKEAVLGLLRSGTALLPEMKVSTRSSWIEFTSDEEMFINLDGEPTAAKHFRVECERRLLPVHLGSTPLCGEDG